MIDCACWPLSTSAVASSVRGAVTDADSVRTELLPQALGT
jgi:hypothetical protein